MYDALVIRDALGALADGTAVDAELRTSALEALSGIVETADRGPQKFIVGVTEANLPNCDTAELIWPRDPDEAVDDDDTPLEYLTDEALFETERSRWIERDPVSWTAYYWRVAAPLLRCLAS